MSADQHDPSESHQDLEVFDKLLELEDQLEPNPASGWRLVISITAVVLPTVGAVVWMAQSLSVPPLQTVVLLLSALLVLFPVAVMAARAFRRGKEVRRIKAEVADLTSGSSSPKQLSASGRGDPPEEAS